MTTAVLLRWFLGAGVVFLGTRWLMLRLRDLIAEVAANKTEEEIAAKSGADRQAEAFIVSFGCLSLLGLLPVLIVSFVITALSLAALVEALL